MSANGNFSYQTPGTYRVFFMDLSSVIISALSQYDAKKKAQAAYAGKMVSHAQLINQTKQVSQAPIAIKSIEVKAKKNIDGAVKTINLDI
jgi:hypothetical protein